MSTNKQGAMPSGRKSSGSDSYVRNVFGIAALVVIGALLTMIFAYLAGVITFDQQAATNIDEFTIVSSQVYADIEQTAGAFSQLAVAQIANGQFIEAEATIQAAYALESPDEERNQGPLFAHARLAQAQGNYDLAIERFEETMFLLRDRFEEVFESDIEPNWAQAFGLHTNYYDAAIALSFLYADREERDKQMEMLDTAIEGYRTNADLFFWRGQLKLYLGDNEGAIEDFTETLRFVPDDAEALAGIEEAGGSVDD
ncbi:MAG: hypothetical protein FWC86_04275 [Coriobacteriia bacterium]|nr:hypothetical protein [Coriobacteriia bacterium]